MIGAEIVARFRPSESSRAAFVGTTTALMTAILLAAGMSTDHTWLVLVLFCLAHVCAGASGPIYQSWFNEQIEGNHRATLLSFQSTFATFGASLGLPGGGRVADAFGVGAAWQTSGLVSALTLPCYWMLRPNHEHTELAAPARGLMEKP
jgi:predicted MFS family arabinose efflux permease